MKAVTKIVTRPLLPAAAAPTPNLLPESFARSEAAQRRAGAQSKTARPAAPSAAKLAQILDRSGYTYEKAADQVWVIKFRGKALPEINLIVTTTDEVAIIGAIIADGKNLRPSPE